MSKYGVKEFARDVDVSRETCERLEKYADLLRHWNPRINLVSRESINDLWRRHLVDSAQLHDVTPSYDGALIDVGSGAGFPGMVLAIMGLPNVHLIDSNLRKCTFLREVARQTNCDVTVHNIRLGEGNSTHDLPKAEIITARAVTQLVNLLDIVSTLVYDRTYCMFHKGSRVDAELKIARGKWQFDLERFVSKSDPSGAILKLSHMRRHHDIGAEE